jgi:hypothetical protein
MTSAATNDLRVLENAVTGRSRRDFLRAPNPLEALSIPVLERPSLLAIDEGRNSEGARVTGAYVYASRPGASEVSVVSVVENRQLGGRPMATPAPVTAISGFMDVDLAAPAFETHLPAKTRLFVATWDGDFASVYSAELATNLPDLARLDFKRLLLLDRAPITAMQAVAPLASRTLDGAAFCAVKACLALATRKSAGLTGESILFEPESGRSARLSFSGPVRHFASSTDASRLYGVLDEQACGGPACGGVVAVELVAGTSGTGFPAALDALGLPMAPMRTPGGLITGLTLATGGLIRQTVETESTDGGATGISALVQQYKELGAFSSSDGTITFFSGFGGSIIDFDGRRTVVSHSSEKMEGSSAPTRRPRWPSTSICPRPGVPPPSPPRTATRGRSTSRTATSTASRSSSRPAARFQGCRRCRRAAQMEFACRPAGMKAARR